MKEAKITCTCKSYMVKDLGLSMVQGDIVYIPAEKARTSRDLEVAKWSKGIQVEYVQRTKTVRDPKVTVTPLKGLSSRSPFKAPPSSDHEKALMEKVESQVAEIQQLRSQLEGFQSAVLSALQNQTYTPLPPRVEASTPSPSLDPVSEEASSPVFIPSDLVDHKAEVAADVKRKRTKNQEVQDAAKALKAARKKKD